MNVSLCSLQPPTLQWQLVTVALSPPPIIINELNSRSWCLTAPSSKSQVSTMTHSPPNITATVRLHLVWQKFKTAYQHDQMAQTGSVSPSEATAAIMDVSLVESCRQLDSASSSLLIL